MATYFFWHLIKARHSVVRGSVPEEALNVSLHLPGTFPAVIDAPNDTSQRVHVRGRATVDCVGSISMPSWIPAYFWSQEVQIGLGYWWQLWIRLLDRPNLAPSLLTCVAEVKAKYLEGPLLVDYNGLWAEVTMEELDVVVKEDQSFGELLQAILDLYFKQFVIS